MKHSDVYLVAIALLHACVTALDESYFWLHAPDGAGLETAGWMRSPFLYWVPLVVLLCVWCLVNARSRAVRMPFWKALLVALLFPIGVPYYYWTTYPRASAIAHLGLFASFLGICFAALWGGRKLAHYYFLNVA